MCSTRQSDRAGSGKVISLIVSRLPDGPLEPAHCTIVDQERSSPHDERGPTSIVGWHWRRRICRPSKGSQGHQRRRPQLSVCPCSLGPFPQISKKTPLPQTFGVARAGCRAFHRHYGLSINSTLTVADPGKANRVSEVIHLCSSRSRRPCSPSLASSYLGMSYSMVMRAFMASPPYPTICPISPSLAWPSRQPFDRVLYP
jgi:hypothetical protein